MKTSARMRSVSQSVQPEDHVSPKRQRTGSVKPKEKARQAPSVIEEVESDAEEPVVERSKKKVAAKPAQEKAKRAPSVTEDGESETEEPMVEQPKKKVAAKTTVPEKKAKENRPMMPRVTVRKVSLPRPSGPQVSMLKLRLHRLTKSPRMATTATLLHQRRRLEHQLEASAHNLR